MCGTEARSATIPAQRRRLPSQRIVFVAYRHAERSPASPSLGESLRSRKRKSANCGKAQPNGFAVTANGDGRQSPSRKRLTAISSKHMDFGFKALFRCVETPHRVQTGRDGDLRSQRLCMQQDSFNPVVTNRPRCRFRVSVTPSSHIRHTHEIWKG